MDSSNHKLDPEMIEQLKSVFSALESRIEFIVEPCSHSDQSGLLDLLESLELCSPSLKVKQSQNQNHAPYPQFEIAVGGRLSGIVFKGIPSGHEFTSLVLAILNVDRKGKFPDQSIQDRIANLKGSIRLRTFISLSCENCPEVVQALNQMTVIHPDFKHEMIDGHYEQDEITRLGIQGVPSILIGDRLIHSGKISFIDLLTKLEEVFGKKQEVVSKDLGKYDVVVVGGGPAGISTAIYSIRKGLKTALIAEKMGGQVQETKGIENMISVSYTEGPKLVGQLIEHLRSYPVDVYEHRKVKEINKDTQEIVLTSEERLTAKSLVIATGAKWRELNVPGEKEYLGKGVAFCPHCDGPFYKGKKVAVIGGGNSGVEAAIDLSGIVKEVVLLEYNKDLKADKVLVDKMKSIPNITYLTSAQTSEVTGDGTKVTRLSYLNRESQQLSHIELDGVFVQIGLVPNSQFLKGIVELSPFGEIKTDGKGRTNVPWIYAAGDVTTTPYKQIIIAMGEGAKVGLGVFEDQMLR